MKSYVVTGASDGIGKAVARALAQRGAKVVGVARSQKRLDETAAAFPDLFRPVVADLAYQDGFEVLANAVRNESGIAGIVHSAGSHVALEPYESMDAKALVDHFQVHVAAPVALYQRIAQAASVSRMLFIDSYSATEPRDGWGAYSIIKSAAQMAARCAAQELKDTAIIRVFPGAVNTNVVTKVLASDTKTALAFKAMGERGQIAEPRDVAMFITQLLVDAPVELLRSVEAWDYNNSNHHDLVGNAARENHSG